MPNTLHISKQCLHCVAQWIKYQAAASKSSEFEIQSLCDVVFWTNTFGNGLNPLSLSAIG